MRQLITRLDDDLHQRLKRRAAADARSVNSLVVNFLADGLDDADERGRLRARLDAAGLLVVPPRPARPLSRDDAIAATRGSGQAASRGLDSDRRR